MEVSGQLHAPADIASKFITHNQPSVRRCVKYTAE